MLCFTTSFAFGSNNLNSKQLKTQDTIITKTDTLTHNPGMDSVLIKHNYLECSPPIKDELRYKCYFDEKDFNYMREL